MQRTLYGLARSIAYKALAKHRRATASHLQASSCAATPTAALSKVENEEAPPHTPSADAKKAFADLASEANKRELSGSENFDKSVLTLSSAGLGLSLTFLKDFIALSSATTKWALYGSWVAFTLATVGTMLSFICSGRAQRLQLKAAEDYYICGNESALTRTNKWARFNAALNGLACVAFILALILTVIFIWSNVEGDRLMSKTTSTEQKGAPPPVFHRLPAEAPAAPAQSPTAPASAPNSSGQGNKAG